MKVEILESQAITQLISEYWRVSILDETTSTQTEIKSSNPKPWHLIATEFQSAGRGRLDRKFEAPKYSALLFSFYIEPIRDKSDWGFIPLLAGLELANTINNLTSSDLYKCKWPNDLMANDKKIAGILAEVHGSGIVIGIGINITMTKDQLPIESASSVLLESNIKLSRNIVLANFCNNFSRSFKDWDLGMGFVEEFSEICSTLNKKVKVVDPEGERLGKALAISNSGSLILDNGEEITVGDVIHLRD